MASEGMDPEPDDGNDNNEPPTMQEIVQGPCPMGLETRELSEGAKEGAISEEPVRSEEPVSGDGCSTHEDVLNFLAGLSPSPAVCQRLVSVPCVS